MACSCYLRCIEKSFNYSGGDIYIGHRLFLPLPLPVKWKAKAPTLKGKKGLNRTLLVNWVLWQLAAHTSCSLVMSTYSFALLYEYLMGPHWEHIGNFKNPKDPKILPYFPPGKERKKNWTFWVSAALSHGLRGIYVPNGVQHHPFLLALNTPLHRVCTFMHTTYVC